MSLPVSNGGVYQLLFNVTSRVVLATTANALYTIDLHSANLAEAPLPMVRLSLRWIDLPRSAEHLLGFGDEQIYVWSWHNLQQEGVVRFRPMKPNRPPREQPVISSRSSGWGFRGSLRKPIVTADKSQVILSIPNGSSSLRDGLDYLLFPFSSK